jgi:prephenate dehydratase
MEDRVGALHKVVSDLNAHGVSMEALWAWAEEEGQAKVVFVPSDPAVVAGCGCETCCAAQASQVLWVQTEDKVGVLRDNLAQLAAAGINLRAVQAMGMRGQAGLIFVFADEATLDAAAKVLGECCTE